MNFVSVAAAMMFIDKMESLTAEDKSILKSLVTITVNKELYNLRHEIYFHKN